MRQVIVSTIISLDGYHEGPGKDVMALPFDPGFSAYNLERVRSAGTLVLGRTSFENALAYWPQVEDDASQNATEREISACQNAIEKVVVSDSLRPDGTGVWAATTRIVPRADAVAVVEGLKDGPGGDVVVFGSRTLWNHLLVAGVVDELHVMIGPALLGAGTPLFGGSAPVPLRLLDSRVLPDSSLVLARYAPEVSGRPR